MSIGYEVWVWARAGVGARKNSVKAKQAEESIVGFMAIGRTRACWVLSVGGPRDQWINKKCLELIRDQSKSS